MRETGPADHERRVRRGALALIAFMVIAQLAATTRGPFRADDWINLEQGMRAWSPAWRDTWTQLNPFTLYRPLVDVWHGGMLRLFGLNARPMLAILVGLLVLQSWLLARLVRARGGSREVAVLAAAALWAQPNTFTWTTLWVSNVTGSLMTTFALLVLLLHHRAVRVTARGGSPAPTLAALTLAFLLGALCKEETVLLVPIVGVLELARWRRLNAAERRGAIVAFVVLAVVGVAYALFRTRVLPTPQEGASRYHLTAGMHVLRNLGFYVVHLGALPAVALAISALLYPGIRRPESRSGPAWEMACEAAFAGVAWALVALALYLPIQGRPAYGYLYAPAMGIAYAVAHGLAWAAGRPADRRRSPVLPLAVHMGLALALTITGLVGIGWHRYRGLRRALIAVVHREMPNPAPGTHVLFLDLGRNETFSGRSLFNLVFDDATGPLLRIHHPDWRVETRVLHGEAAEQAARFGSPWADVVFEARQGHIVRIANRAAPDRAVRPIEASNRDVAPTDRASSLPLANPR